MLYDPNPIMKYYYPRFADEEIEAQGSVEPSPISGEAKLFVCHYP